MFGLNEGKGRGGEEFELNICLVHEGRREIIKLNYHFTLT
jgi:hypothetical protein